MFELTLFKPPHYRAYLVRLWQDHPDSPWRSSAQCASSGEKYYFATLDALFAFLQAQTVAGQDNNSVPPFSTH